MKIKLPNMDHETVANEIGDFIVKTILEFNMTGGVMGLSGGVDSTTVAAITKKAFDKHNKDNDIKLELVGYILPSKANSPKDAEDGIKVAEKLGIRYETQEIEPIISAYKQSNPEAVEVPYHKGNIMARIRANILSTKSATEKKTLIGTGNKDEDFGVGYYTLFGDGAVHLSPIGNLSKRLVRQMAAHLGFPEIAKRVATAGLEPDQTDLSDLGYSYKTVELVMLGLEQGLNFQELIKNEQIVQEIKPNLKPVGKFDDVEQTIKDILERHRIALGKMRIIHPPAPEITLNYE
ncbi:NAD(+) synthase [Candidatus Pacearchaeota archaeon]|nr:NAD(+) synthase [Candidatus Pacearchaeota archaeon]